jgi:GH25 family lysozyme M1 (1,4-beta-N-acetylmuramidase)
MTTTIKRAERAKFLSVFILLILAAVPARSLARDFGSDVSHYQGESGISQSSWNQMFAEGKRFTFIKASEGLTGPDDAAMANNVARASAAGLLVGVYHYAHPENRPTNGGAVLEADHFLNYAGSAIGPGRLRPVLDLEGSSANLSTTALTDWVIAFSNRIIAERGPGAAPIIYVNRSYAKSELDSRMANYDLWLAYPTNVDVSISEPPPTGTFPDATGVFNNWSFWQYSWTGSSGGISPLDLDVCHSEYKSLASFLIPYPAIVLSSRLNGSGAFQFSFTNTPGRSFTALNTTNLSLPFSNWTVLGSIFESPAGYFQFTDTSMTNNSRRFYGVRSP